MAYLDPEAGIAREHGRAGAEGLYARTRTATGRYKFSEDGGVTGLKNLASSQLPSGAIVTDARIDVIVAPTSGGLATIAIGLNAANDLKTATAFDAEPYATTGAKALSGANVVKTTAARKITATIATANLTAGEFVVYVDYIDTRTG